MVNWQKDILNKSGWRKRSKYRHGKPTAWKI